MSTSPSDGIAKQLISPELLTTKQAAELLGLGERTLWRYANSGRAPAPIRIGATVRYRRAELLEWIANGCPEIRRA